MVRWIPELDFLPISKRPTWASLAAPGEVAVLHYRRLK
jgi:hypothetical protein